MPVYSTYRAPLDDIDPEQYPMILTSGGRLPNALHSRLHDVSWLRTLRPKACAELNPQDAAALGIRQDDLVEISTPVGSITAVALLSNHIQKGLVIHPATTTHSQLSEAELADQGITPSTIRLSIGTEHIDDIIADLEKGFASVK